jgi:hypothetical protein
VAEPPRKDPCPTPEPIDNVEEVKKLARSFGLRGNDIQRFSQLNTDAPMLVATLMPMDFAMRRHPVAYNFVRRMMAQADRARVLNQWFGRKWDTITGYDPRSGKIRRMTDKEVADYASVMLKTEEKDWLTDEELKASPIAQKAKDLYVLHRRVMRGSLMLINAVRKAKEQPLIGGIKGVMFPHELNGNFHIEVRGKPLYVEGGSAWDTQADAYEALRKHFAEHPEDLGHAEIIADYGRTLSYAVLGDPERMGNLNDALAAVARGSHVSTEKAAQWYRDGLKKRGFATHMEPRMGHPGYETNQVIRVMSEYLNTMPWWVTAELAKLDVHDMLGQIDPAKEPHVTAALHRYIAQIYGVPGDLEMQVDQFINSVAQGKVGRVLTNALTPLENVPLLGRPAKFLNPARLNPVRPLRRASERARGLTGDLKLGFVATGVTLAHALHAPTNMWPLLGTRHYAHGWLDTIHYDPEMHHAYNWGEHHLVWKSSLLDDSPGGPFTRLVDRVADAVNASPEAREVMYSIWRPIGLSEQYMRQAAFFGAYRALKEQGVAGHRLLRLATNDALDQFPELGKYNERFMLEMARRIVDHVNFRYDRASRAYWTTGPVGGLAGQFKTYVMGTFALQKRMWDMGGTNKYRALAPLGMMIALGGISGGVPLAHLLDDGFRLFTGGLGLNNGQGISPLDELYLFLRHEKELGHRGAQAIYRGLPALIGMDLSRRIGYSHLHFEGLKDVPGAFGSVIHDFVTALYFHDLDHALILTPSLHNWYEANKWAHEHYADDPNHRNRPRFSPSRFDMYWRALGIEPSRQSQVTDALRIGGRRDAATKSHRIELIEKMVKAVKAGDNDAYVKWQEEALANDMLITPKDVAHELTQKGKSALERRAESLNKADRPWFLQEFGKEIQREKDQEAERAERAVQDIQQGGGQ